MSLAELFDKARRRGLSCRMFSQLRRKPSKRGSSAMPVTCGQMVVTSQRYAMRGRCWVAGGKVTFTKSPPVRAAS